MNDFVLLANKPKGISSFSFINKIKKENSFNKIGHSGTLDPIAEGLMLVLINDATKFSNYLISEDKTYYVELELGYETDTFDSEGMITNKYNLENISLDYEKINMIIKKFIGKQKQIPPMYSAIKKNGVKLYDLARKGINLELEGRNIQIYNIWDISIFDYKVSFRVKVSKGTYIRALVRDIGRELGYFATMIRLVREEINTYSLKEVGKKIKLVDIIESPIINLNYDEYIFIKNGMTKIFYNLNINDKFIKAFYNNEFVGMLEIKNKEKNKYYIKRGFYFK